MPTSTPTCIRPLLQWEISYPTGESGIVEQQLPTAALMVERDPEDPYALCLRHASTGKRVIPVDLGFLNPRIASAALSAAHVVHAAVQLFHQVSGGALYP